MKINWNEKIINFNLKISLKTENFRLIRHRMTLILKIWSSIAILPNPTNATIDTNYLNIAMKKNEGWIRREIRANQNKQKYSRVHSKSSQHKYEWYQHSVIWNWYFQIQKLDLKSKNLWSGKFTELMSKCTSRNKSEQIWKKCRELRHLYSAHGIVFQNANSEVGADDRLKYSYEQAFSCMHIIKI